MCRSVVQSKHRRGCQKASESERKMPIVIRYWVAGNPHCLQIDIRRQLAAAVLTTQRCDRSVGRPKVVTVSLDSSLLVTAKLFSLAKRGPYRSRATQQCHTLHLISRFS